MPDAMIDLPDLFIEIPAGAWVAISERERRVIAYGVDPQAVLNESRASGEEHPLIVRVPERNSSMFL